MQRSASSLKNLQRTFSRSLSNSTSVHRPLQTPLPLSLAGTISPLPRFTDIFDVPHRLGESLDSGAPREHTTAREIREPMPFLIDLTLSDFHSLPPATLFDGPARRSKGRTAAFPGVVGTPRRTMTRSTVPHQSERLVQVFDGPSHYNRRCYRPTRKERKSTAAIAFGAVMVVGGGVVLSLQ